MTLTLYKGCRICSQGLEGALEEVDYQAYKVGMVAGGGTNTEPPTALSRDSGADTGESEDTVTTPDVFQPPLTY